MRCGNNCYKDYIDNLYSWLFEVMLNYSSEFIAIQIRNLGCFIKFKFKRTEKEVNWEFDRESHGKPNAGLINNKRIMYKRNYVKEP